MTKVTTTSATTATELKEFAKRAKGANEFKFTKDGVKRPIYDLVKNIDVVAGVSGTVEFLKLKRKVMGNGKRGRIESQEPVELTEIDPIKKEEISDAAKYVKGTREVRRRQRQLAAARLGNCRRRDGHGAG